MRVEWNETVRTCQDPFDTKKFSNLSPEILVEWIAPSETGPVSVDWQTCYVKMVEQRISLSELVAQSAE